MNVTRTSIDPDDLEREARNRTGLEDFGLGSWRTGLETLVDAAEREARLSELGRSILAAEMVDHLANRLEILAGDEVLGTPIRT